MTTLNNFEQATRGNVTFESTKGLLTIQDVWQLPMESKNSVSLDSLSREINKQLKETEEESFIAKKTPKNVLLQLKMDLVLRIIEVCMEETEARKQASNIKAEEQELLELRAELEKESKKKMTLEEIDAKLATLKAK